MKQGSLVTDRTISVRAQWALHGKALDDEGYRVIACSNGDLSKANFADALGRFALGALDKLPQVSVSYVQPAGRVAGGYLALAIHWSAGNGKRYADGVDRVDNLGRPTTFTNYFCVPYAALAPYGINYLDMYKAFSAFTLQVKDGPPQEVRITPPTRRVPAVDDLAVRVAPLLLTGAPVCVLDADETSLDERLRFIDTVMGLLPYGYRARMAAATWTRPTNRNHRFRLFFSSEPRSAEKQDRVVSWGAPEQVQIPSRDAYYYYQWLSAKVTPLAGLTQLTGEAGFGDSADSQALQLVDGRKLWQLERLSASRAPGRQPSPAQASPAQAGSAQARPPAPAEDPVEKILTECADHVQALDMPGVRQDVRLLNGRLGSGQVSEELRGRCQSLIAQYGLLKPSPELKRSEGPLYEALLALAFGDQVTYDGLCQVEDWLGLDLGQSLHKRLLEAIVQIGLGDLRTRVLVQLDLEPSRLPRFLSTKDSDAHALIRELAQGAWHRKRHGRVLCDVTLRYLQERRGQYATTEIQRELFRYGYLAQALRDVGSEQYQVYALSMLLVAAFPEEKYPGGLDQASIREILASTPDAPTPALLAAVLRKIPAASAPDAWDAFIYGSITHMNLDEGTHGYLWTRLPAIEQEPEPAQETVVVPPPGQPGQSAGRLAMETQPAAALPAGLPSAEEEAYRERQRQAAYSWQMEGETLWQHEGAHERPAYPDPGSDTDPPDWVNPARR